MSWPEMSSDSSRKSSVLYQLLSQLKLCRSIHNPPRNVMYCTHTHLTRRGIRLAEKVYDGPGSPLTRLITETVA